MHLLVQQWRFEAVAAGMLCMDISIVDPLLQWRHWLNNAELS
jgi:hypothetical protein